MREPWPCHSRPKSHQRRPGQKRRPTKSPMVGRSGRPRWPTCCFLGGDSARIFHIGARQFFSAFRAAFRGEKRNRTEAFDAHRRALSSAEKKHKTCRWLLRPQASPQRKPIDRPKSPKPIPVASHQLHHCCFWSEVQYFPALVWRKGAKIVVVVPGLEKTRVNDVCALLLFSWYLVPPPWIPLKAF